MKKLFYLSTCSTCKQIMDDLGNEVEEFELIDIKARNIESDEIDMMVRLSGSFESLFSRRAMKFKSMGLAKQELTEEDYRNLILEEYTFLKRPVFLFENEIFIGNSKKEIERLKTYLTSQ
ncbi:MAG: arsenate reductase [Cyclobacteriaceae bacterium]